MQVPTRSLFAALLGLLCASAAQATIDSVTRLTSEPKRFERLDYTVMLNTNFSNPHDARQVALDFEVAAPSGKKLLVPAFYLMGDSGKPSQWMLRFTPVEAGRYTGSFVLRNGEAVEKSPEQSFDVLPGLGRGFLHAGDDWTFRYSDGTPFRGIGENICWEARLEDDSKFFSDLHEQPRFNYEYMLGTLAASGGNYFRTWMCSWNLPLEWKAPSNSPRYHADEAPFNRSAMQRMDELVELSDRLGIHMMLCLDTAGSFGGDWAKHNYAIANGGPAAEPREFFTAPESRARFKNRLRFLIARWGWSPSIGAWEFFNEIDNGMYGMKPRLEDAIVVDWHREMADYLKKTDPYGHLVTTSISHRDVEGLWTIPSMDFNQHHIYKNTSGMPASIAERVQRTGKPHVIGEFGYEWDWSKNFNEFGAEMDRDYVRGLWLGLFSNTPILPMSWWWEFFDSRNVRAKMLPVRQVSDEMLAAGKGVFTALKTSTSDKALSALSVRCGSTIYAFAWTDAAQADSLNYSVELPAGDYVLEVFDAEKSVWTPLGKHTVKAKDASLSLPYKAGQGTYGALLRLSPKH